MSVTNTSLTGPADILKDLENIYISAMDKKNLAVALKVKELLGREVGLFSPKNRVLQNISLADLTEDDIDHLIEEIEQHEKQEKEFVI